MTQASQRAEETAAEPLIVIAGPTASGKSALALQVAEAITGTIVNADALQVYRDLRLLSARPSEAEERAVPHRLYGFLPASERCTAGRWRALALAEIAAARRAGRQPLLVGGSGLYLKALEKGLAEIPPVPAEVRAEGEAHYARLGGPAFRAALVERDPSAERLAPGDRQRLVRAWEVLEATGRTLASWHAAGREGTGALRWLRFVVVPPRVQLYQACDRRFAAMVEAGAVEEVRALLALDLDPALPVMKAVGVRELGRYLRGEIALEDAVALGQAATRRYAKRQTTWLRGQMGLKDWILPDGDALPAGDGGAVRAVPTAQGRGKTYLIGAQYSERLSESIFSIIRRFLLTDRW